MGTRSMRWLTVEHWLIGASLMRVSLGAWAVFYYLLHWPYRAYLWGPGGVLPHAKFLEMIGTPNLFAYGTSPASFEAVYVGAIAVAMMLVFGVLPRVMIPIQWFIIWSFQERNPFLGDGGDNIMRIVLLFLVLVNTGAYFSIHAAMRPGTGQKRQGQPALAIIHNIGILLIIAQLCFVYMSTGLYKVMGELWQNGTALYYILRVDEFSLPAVAELIYRSSYLVVFGTYATVLFEILFAPALLNKWTRYLMIATGIFFHLGIAVLMGLVTFGWSMLSIYPLLVTDEEYQRAARWVKDRFQLTVLYDADCSFCTRAVRVMGAGNLFSLVEYAPYQVPGILEEHGITVDRAERRMQSTTPGGALREGMDTMVQIFGRSPLLWPFFPMMWICRLVLGHRTYDWVAERRHRILPGRCRV